MTIKQRTLLITPIILMLVPVLTMGGVEHWIANLAGNPNAYRTLGRIGLALPYLTAAGLGIVFLLATQGSPDIRSAGTGVLMGGLLAGIIGLGLECARMIAVLLSVPANQFSSHVDPYQLGALAIVFGSAGFGLSVNQRGDRV